MFALVDCNNFYCSCERLFNPKLEGRPVVVLSNNDGCAIARSEEAKAIGIQMGTPEFMIRDQLKQHNVAVFSSNYTLYGDISDRVMKTLSAFAPQMEMYSIDEAFLDMHGMDVHDLLKVGINIRNTVKKNIGIPVTVGIGSTKTLAKMANDYAKKRYKEVGVFWAANDGLVQTMLTYFEVEDIWGIGRERAKLLRLNGFAKAIDILKAPPDWIRQKMSVVGLRMLHELKGIPSIEWEFEAPPKKNICTSRSFGKLITDPVILCEALSAYTATCALKLRQQKSCATCIYFFLQTNPHRTQDKQYLKGVTIKLPIASNHTPELIRYAKKAFDIIYKPGMNYMKCGVMVLDIISQTEVQGGLFDEENRPKQKQVMQSLDRINAVFGKDLVRFAAQGYERKYRLKAEYLSKKYTTNINDIINIKN